MESKPNDASIAEQPKPKRKSNRRSPHLPIPMMEEGAATCIEIRLGAGLHNRIATINNGRKGFRNLSDTVRLLLSLGCEQYEQNQLAGVRTAKKNQEQTARKRAEAEAIAARRELEKERKAAGKKSSNGKPASVAPVLFDWQPDKDKERED